MLWCSIINQIYSKKYVQCWQKIYSILNPKNNVLLVNLGMFNLFCCLSCCECDVWKPDLTFLGGSRFYMTWTSTNCFFVLCTLWYMLTRFQSFFLFWTIFFSTYDLLLNKWFLTLTMLFLYVYVYIWNRAYLAYDNIIML